MKEFKDYFSKSEIVLWSSSVMVKRKNSKRYGLTILDNSSLSVG